MNDNRNHAARMIESNKEVIDQLKAANAEGIERLRKDMKHQLAEQKEFRGSWRVEMASEFSKMCIKLQVEKNTPRSDTNPSDSNFVMPKGTAAPTSFRFMATGGIRKCPQLFQPVVVCPTSADDDAMEEEGERVEERKLPPSPPLPLRRKRK